LDLVWINSTQQGSILGALLSPNTFAVIEFYPNAYFYLSLEEHTQLEIVRFVSRHFHLHPLVPIEGMPNSGINAMVLNADDIWILSVWEVYKLCRRENLPGAFRYLWKKLVSSQEVVHLGALKFPGPHSEWENYNLD
jgi:hypothetical protein